MIVARFSSIIEIGKKLIRLLGDGKSRKQVVKRMAETEQQRKEMERQEDLIKLRGLRPMDDDFMRCIFKDNIPLAELVLMTSSVMGNPITGLNVWTWIRMVSRYLMTESIFCM